MQIELSHRVSSDVRPSMTVVIPVFNEVDGVEALAQRLDEVLAAIVDYQVIFIDDGSSDGTANTLRLVAARNPNVRFIILSKNCGHQTAMRAGLDHADADCIVTMDGDFQHPPEFIPKMFQQWRQGAKVVLTRRVGEERLGPFKRRTSGLYYVVINALSDVKIERGAADFRLIDRSVLQSLKRFTEHDIFYRGIIPLVGYKSVTLDYELQDRRFGSSKYSLQKMFQLGMKGVLSSSTRPLRLAMAGAFAVFATAGFYLVYILTAYFIVGAKITGWTSMILTVLILGASQLLVLGIIGEYVGQLLIEVRSRPSYFIAETNIEDR